MSSHLTEAEHQAIIDEVKSRRTPETYIEGKWSVSPLNRAPEVLGAKPPQSFPKSIRICDITLRTIEQAPGVVVGPEQRIRLAEALIEAGVKWLQLAWLASPRGFAQLSTEVRSIRSLAPDIELSSLGAGRAQLDQAIEAGITSFQVYGPSIPSFHPIYGSYGRQILRAHWRGEDWRKTVKYPRDESEHLAMFEEQIGYLKSKGVRAAAFTTMLHYATPDYLRRFAKRAQDAGADEVFLGDGASGLGPEAWRYVVAIIRESAPRVAVGLHTHNAFGLVLANTLAGLHAGAEIAEVSVNGVCSAAGQADLAELAASLEVIYGVSTGVRLDKLTALRRLVEDMTGIRMAPNKAITGEQAWTYTEEAIREESAYAPVHKAAEPHVFGNHARYALGPHSGTWNLMSKLDELDLSLEDAQIPALLDRVKAEMLVRRRSLADEELLSLAVKAGAAQRPGRAATTGHGN